MGENTNETGTIFRAINLKTPWAISHEQYMELLQEHVGFNGNYDTGASLLMNLSDGIQDVKQNYDRQGLQYEPPTLGIIFGESMRHYPSAYYNDRDNAVMINLNLLEDMAFMPQEEILDFKRDDGFVTFRGTMKDMAHAIGVEEAHHALFVQQKGEQKDLVDPTNLPVDEYHARDDEYLALLAKRRLGIKRGYPTETVDFLSRMIKDAASVRLK